MCRPHFQHLSEFLHQLRMFDSTSFMQCFHRCLFYVDFFFDFFICLSWIMMLRVAVFLNRVSRLRCLSFEVITGSYQAHTFRYSVVIHISYALYALQIHIIFHYILKGQWVFALRHNGVIWLMRFRIFKTTQAGIFPLCSYLPHRYELALRFTLLRSQPDPCHRRPTCCLVPHHSACARAAHPADWERSTHWCVSLPNILCKNFPVLFPVCQMLASTLLFWCKSWSSKRT